MTLKELTLAEHEMPGLMETRKEYGPKQPFKGLNINGSCIFRRQNPGVLWGPLGSPGVPWGPWGSVGSCGPLGSPGIPWVSPGSTGGPQWGNPRGVMSSSSSSGSKNLKNIFVVGVVAVVIYAAFFCECLSRSESQEQEEAQDRTKRKGCATPCTGNTTRATGKFSSTANLKKGKKTTKHEYFRQALIHRALATTVSQFSHRRAIFDECFTVLPPERHPSCHQKVIFDDSFSVLQPE